MQQHSRESFAADMRSGASGLFAPGSRWLALLSSIQSLLAHVGLMLAVTGGLMLVNLLVTPGLLWSRSIVVVWLVVLVAHAIGLVITRLLHDDTSTVGQTTPTHAEPHVGAMAGWTQANGQPETETFSAAELNRTDPWKDVAAPTEEAETSWPHAPTATAAPDTTEADDRPKQNGASGDTNDKVPWRAATEIAWLRRPRATEDDERDHRGSGS